ncbi:MAG: hypothetical protein U0271_43825 [Polyangiaceae bacterium]
MASAIDIEVAPRKAAGARSSASGGAKLGSQITAGVSDDAVCEACEDAVCEDAVCEDATWDDAVCEGAGVLEVVLAVDDELELDVALG